MPIYVDVISRLDERSAAVAARNIERQFSDAGQRAGQSFQSNMQSGMRGGTSATDQLGRDIASQFVSHGTRAGRGFGSSFGGELTRSIPGVGGFTSMLSGYQGVAGKAGAVAGRALGLAFTTAAAGLIGAAGLTLFKGFERYQAIDAATNRLQNLNRTMQATGRAGFDVQQVMDTVNKSILDTPFAMDQAFSIATRALASNTGDLQRFMTVVSDAAGFAGAGIDEIGEAFLKVANKGKVSMEEIGNELRNIPILPWLQEQLGVTGAELAKMISDGKVGLEDLMKAVEKNAAGFAKASGDTVAGAMANMQTAVARLGANFLGAIFGKPTEDANDLVEVLKTVRERIDDINAWVSANQGEIKKFFQDGVSAARDLIDLIRDATNLLGGFENTIKVAGTAFVAWKTGGALASVSGLTSELGKTNAELGRMPNLAGAAATSILAIGTALRESSNWGNGQPVSPLPNPEDFDPSKRTSSEILYGPVIGPWLDRILGNTPPPAPTAPLPPPVPSTLGGGPNASRERRGLAPIPGGPGPAGAPILPPSGADGTDGPRLPPMPVVPYAGIPALAPGLQQTAALFSAQTSVADATTKLAEKEARVLQLRADNNATADDILNAENDAAKARRDKQEADMRFAEAQQNAFEQQSKKLKQVSSTLGEFGAALDSDFGISKGLAGIADNLVRFVGSLALAGPMAKLQQISDAAGDEGSGLMGILASNGVFGPQFMPNRGGATESAMPSGVASSNPNVNAMLALAQASSGRTAYAPASDLINGLADCSGSISDLYEVLTTGRSTGARMFTTTNFASDAEAAKLGFLPGFMPGALNVGVNPYPGQSGHMAATLPNGVNFEGGGGTGGGALYGAGAAGALDPQFEKQYYLPIGAGTPMATGPVSAPATSPAAVGGFGGIPVPLPVIIVGGFPATATAGGGLVTPPGTPGFTPTPGAAPGGPGVAPSSTPLPPLPTSIPGGAAGGPLGTGFPQGAPGLGGQAYPAQGGGGAGGIGMGGLPMSAISSAVSAGGLAIDAMAPGAGQAAAAAAQIGIQLANRAIKYAGQTAGIGVSGLLETFVPAGDNPKASIGNSWLGKIAGGIASAAPVLPNMAGGKGNQALPPGAGGQGQGQGGNTINNTVNLTNQRATEDMAGNQAVREMGAMYAPSGTQ
jgi:tape measure domain-containing protein